MCPMKTRTFTIFIFVSVQSSHSVMSDPLQPHELQHARLPCPSPIHRACSNSCPQTHNAIHHLILCLPLLLLHSIFPSIRVFSNESVLRIRWPKYYSFSISLSKEYSGLISFRIDWLISLRLVPLQKGPQRVPFHYVMTQQDEAI